jgi:hypothetical protein
LPGDLNYYGVVIGVGTPLGVYGGFAVLPFFLRYLLGIQFVDQPKDFLLAMAFFAMLKPREGCWQKKT